ncbi:phospholipase D family protein [Microcoleus sp. w1-18aA5]|uniref:phospholipase D family protein n=1 Tax=Microcoleus sp. w1-18aA5 TaxID=2818982 RepID=UPI002FD62A70
MNYQFLCDYQENLENKIKFFLDDFQQFSWDKIYIFSAFVSEYGVEKVKEIISHESLNENTEVVVAIGKKTYDINKPIDIQKILDFVKEQNQNKFKTQPISFICPKNDGFHIKAYCFLGRNKKGSQTQIGYSIIGSSNLTKFGFKGKGELCISIDNLELTQKLIDCLSDKYIINNRSYHWDQEIERYKIQHKECQDKKYKDKQSRQDQDEDPEIPVKENSTPVNQSEPRPGKFIKLGVLTDSVLLAKATNLVNDREKIDWFHSSPTTLEEAKADFPEGSLCLLSSTENKIFRIVEIMPYLSHQENTEGCFVRYKENVTYESDDICEILEKEEYKEIKIAEEEYEEYRERNQDPKLEYATLNKFENEVKKMLDDPNYKKGIEKGKKKMQKMQSEIERISKIDNISLIKKELELLRQSI